MSIVQGAQDAQASGSFGRGLCRALMDPRLAPFLLCLAILQQLCGHQNGDNTWLMTVSERLYDGAVAYVDVIETNPPASFLLYLPAVAFARLLHLPVEFVVSLSTFLIAIACIAFAGRSLRQAGLVAQQDEGLLLNTAVFAFIILPGFSFAEREHLAAVGVLPMLAIYAARSEGLRASLGQALLAGLVGGLVVAIKPHFALALLLPLAYVLARRRSVLVAFSPENLVVLAVVVAYVALVVLHYPAFFDVLPSLLDAYVSVKSPLRELLVKPWFALNMVMIAGVVAFAGRGLLRPLVALPLLASLGFIGTFLMQAKGWVNHGLPGVALAFVATAVLVLPGVMALARGAAENGAWQQVRRFVLFCVLPAMLGAPILFGMVIEFMGWEEYTGLTAAVRRQAPAHPRLIAVTGELDIGHPLVRRVDGVWAGRPHSLWLMICSQALIDWNKGDDAFRARLATYVDRDARMFLEDVRAKKPDLILVDDDIRTVKAMRHPDVAAALAGYAPAETVDGVTLWKPRG